MRQKIGKMMVETEVLRYAALRLLSNLQKGKRPGPESSVDKLYYSEMDKRHQEWILEILGPFGQMFEGLPEGMSLDLEATRDGEGTWALQLPLVAGADDLLRLLRDPEEHHRRARVETAARSAGRPPGPGLKRA